MAKKQYAVLGLGIFGSTVATTLAEQGCEVLAVDRDISCVERVASEVTKAVVADVTKIEELSALGIEDFDVAIIAIGTHLEEAVLATMHCKELGVPYVITKAKNKAFMKILERVGADRVIRPEKEIGMKLAKSLLRKNLVDVVELDDDNSIVEIYAPTIWTGKTVKELNVRTKYEMNILGVRDKETEQLSLGVAPDYKVKPRDRFLVLARTEKLEDFDTL
ncbi:potassium channel family protein [Tannockella kyphosi]|uniref:potassium channel family protein n=1 Tax=Tannockella kyphosi TaxID=2899121 RepID=UPI0020126E42|nr:TrkA family potassium uptake protein [Tannockella kyphosi]